MSSRSFKRNGSSSSLSTGNCLSGIISDYKSSGKKTRSSFYSFGELKKLSGSKNSNKSKSRNVLIAKDGSSRSNSEKSVSSFNLYNKGNSTVRNKFINIGGYLNTDDYSNEDYRNSISKANTDRDYSTYSDDIVNKIKSHSPKKLVLSNHDIRKLKFNNIINSQLEVEKKEK